MLRQGLFLFAGLASYLQQAAAVAVSLASAQQQHLELDASGYISDQDWLVTGKSYSFICMLRNEMAMKVFLRRALAQSGYMVRDEAAFTRFTRSALSTRPPFQAMMASTKRAAWVSKATDPISDKADRPHGQTMLTEKGYEFVARTKNDFLMKDYIRWYLRRTGRTVTDEDELNGFVPHYSGTIAVQTFKRLSEELAAAPWVTMLPANVSGVVHAAGDASRAGGLDAAGNGGTAAATSSAPATSSAVVVNASDNQSMNQADGKNSTNHVEERRIVVSSRSLSSASPVTVTFAGSSSNASEIDSMYAGMSEHAQRQLFSQRGYHFIRCLQDVNAMQDYVKWVLQRTNRSVANETALHDFAVAQLNHHASKSFRKLLRSLKDASWVQGKAAPSFPSLVSTGGLAVGSASTTVDISNSSTTTTIATTATTTTTTITTSTTTATATTTTATTSSTSTTTSSSNTTTIATTTTVLTAILPIVTTTTTTTTAIATTTSSVILALAEKELLAFGQDADQKPSKRTEPLELLEPKEVSALFEPTDIGDVFDPSERSVHPESKTPKRDDTLDAFMLDSKGHDHVKEDDTFWPSKSNRTATTVEEDANEYSRKHMVLEPRSTNKAQPIQAFEFQPRDVPFHPNLAQEFLEVPDASTAAVPKRGEGQLPYADAPDKHDEQHDSKWTRKARRAAARHPVAHTSRQVLSERGYMTVASLESTGAMQVYVQRALAARGLKPKSRRLLRKFARRFNGAPGHVQSFVQMQQELDTADWVCSEDEACEEDPKDEDHAEPPADHEIQADTDEPAVVPDDEGTRTRSRRSAAAMAVAEKVLRPKEDTPALVMTPKVKWQEARHSSLVASPSVKWLAKTRAEQRGQRKGRGSRLRRERRVLGALGGEPTQRDEGTEETSPSGPGSRKPGLLDLPTVDDEFLELAHVEDSEAISTSPPAPVRRPRFLEVARPTLEDFAYDVVTEPASTSPPPPVQRPRFLEMAPAQVLDDDSFDVGRLLTGDDMYRDNGASASESLAGETSEMFKRGGMDFASRETFNEEDLQNPSFFHAGSFHADPSLSRSTAFHADTSDTTASAFSDVAPGRDVFEHPASNEIAAISSELSSGPGGLDNFPETRAWIQGLRVRGASLGSGNF